MHAYFLISPQFIVINQFQISYLPVADPAVTSASGILFCQLVAICHRVMSGDCWIHDYWRLCYGCCNGK